MKIKLLLALLCAGATMLSGCKKDDTDNAIHVSTITIEPTTATLESGGQLHLTVNVLPEDAADRSVTWTSSNEEVATVSYGVVTASVVTEVTEVTITAKTTDGGKEATCVITVTPPAVPVVYIAGQQFGKVGDFGKEFNATLWVDGEPQILSTNDSYANSVYVDGEDVYVAGYEYNMGMPSAVLWKNGVAQNIGLDNGYDFSWAIAVAVSGGNVYVAGEILDYETDNTSVVLWTNGVAEVIADNNANAKGIFVAGEDIYIAGRADYGTGGKYLGCATLWMNGEPERITQFDSWANSVYVSKGDVYVAGESANVVGGSDKMAVLWKNGEETWLDEEAPSKASSVFVSGDDVYVLVNDNDATRFTVLWKNDVSEILNETTSNKTLDSGGVYVLNNDVYVAGCDMNSSGEDIAVFWKNGAITRLTEKESTATSIFVK